MKDLHISPRVLRPKQGPILHCAHCDKPQARWDMVLPVLNEQGEPTDDTPVSHDMCAICFLYESKWGQDRRAAIDALIGRVEVNKKMSFLRDPTERLLLAEDADRILAGLALQSRIREAMFEEEDATEGCPSCGFTEGVESGFPDNEYRRACLRCRYEWVVGVKGA